MLIVTWYDTLIVTWYGILSVFVWVHWGKSQNPVSVLSSQRTSIWTRDHLNLTPQCYQRDDTGCRSQCRLRDFSSRFSDVETKKEAHATAINSLRRNVYGLNSSGAGRIPTGRRRAYRQAVTNGSRGTWKYNIYMDGCLHSSITKCSHTP